MPSPARLLALGRQAVGLLASGDPVDRTRVLAPPAALVRGARTTGADRLVAGYARGAEITGSEALVATALRTRSAIARDAVELLARRTGAVHWRAALGEVLAVSDDRADEGFAILAEVVDRDGARRLTARQQLLHAHGLVLAGAADRFARDLPALTRLEEDSVRALRADVAHPQAGGDPDAWWHLLTAGWAATGRIVPALREPTGPEDTAFDRLTAPADVVAARRDALAAELTAAGRDVPRVSIVVCTHEPGPFLATAMASLRDQTWPDLEVVLVDDGSSPEGASAVEEAAAIVPGCRVLHLPRNVGAFAARNAGFTAATGDLLGNLDSDDWNHPERVERQVLPMLDDPAVVATESGALRALPDLRTTWLGYPATRVNASSTLVRREVHEAIGWFDSARRGGDAELQERIDRRYPGGRHVVDEVLSITRLREGSLSRADFRMGWARAPWIVHQSAYRAWHGRLPAGPPTAVEGGAGEVAAREADGGAGVWPRLDGSGQRRFALPRTWVTDAPFDLDVVLVDDPADTMDAPGALAGILRGLADAGLRVGLLPRENEARLRRHRVMIRSDVQALVDDGRLVVVEPEADGHARLVHVRTPACVATGRVAPSLTADAVVVRDPGSARVGRVPVAWTRESVETELGRWAVATPLAWCGPGDTPAETVRVVQAHLSSLESPPLRS